MKKKVYTEITLTCILQQTDSIPEDKCLTGVISLKGKKGRFEEAIRKPRNKPALKIFLGEYVSMTHMKNGRYQCHMKTIDASGINDRERLAGKVCQELLEAFKYMD